MERRVTMRLILIYTSANDSSIRRINDVEGFNDGNYKFMSPFGLAWIVSLRAICVSLWPRSVRLCLLRTPRRSSLELARFLTAPLLRPLLVPSVDRSQTVTARFAEATCFTGVKVERVTKTVQQDLLHLVSHSGLIL